MIDREKVIRGLECCGYIDRPNCADCPEDGPGFGFACRDDLMKKALAILKAQEPITGETSDGYHTFNELYHHRAVLFSVIVANYPGRAWKSKRHYDGTMYDGMFIVGINTPNGQATYHYDLEPYWDMFECRELERAPEWDGHTPTQAIERIGMLKSQEPRVMTLEEVEDALDTVIWVDRPDFDNSSDEYALIKSYSRKEGYMTIAYFCGYHDATMFYNLYGKKWRCWDKRPTDEQREAVKWG